MLFTICCTTLLTLILTTSTSSTTPESSSAENDLIYDRLRLALQQDDTAVVKKMGARIRYSDENLNLALIRASSTGNCGMIQVLLDNSDRGSGDSSQGSPYTVSRKPRLKPNKIDIQAALSASIEGQKFGSLMLLLDHFVKQEDSEDTVVKTLLDLIDQALERNWGKAVYRLSCLLETCPPRLLWKAAELDNTGIFQAFPPDDYDEETYEDVLQVAIHHDSEQVLNHFLTGQGCRFRQKDWVLADCVHNRSALCFGHCITLKLLNLTEFSDDAILACLPTVLKNRDYGILLKLFEYIGRTGRLHQHLDKFYEVRAFLFIKIMFTMNTHAMKLFGDHFSRDIADSLIVSELSKYKDRVELPMMMKGLTLVRFDYISFIGSRAARWYGKHISSHPFLQKCSNLHEALRSMNILKILEASRDMHFSPLQRSNLVAINLAFRVFTKVLEAINRFDIVAVVKIMREYRPARKSKYFRWQVRMILSTMTEGWLHIARSHLLKGYVSRKEMYCICFLALMQKPN